METNEAIRHLLEALKLSPENVPLRLQLALTFLELERYEEAENQYKQILELKAGDPSARLGLARTSYLQGKYSTALVILEDLLELTPKDKKAWLLYAKSLLKDEAIAKAVEAYQKVLEIDPHHRDDELDRHLRLAHHDQEEEEGENEYDDDLLDFLEKPGTSFKDVGGMSRLKEEIGLKIIQPLRHPELYQAYGKKIGGGILLYGPPGCGKTYLAKATAGEVDAHFLNIGIHDILDMWIGNSEKNLHEVFEMARDHTPCVLFFDEVDALGASRSDLRQSGSRHLINQFLAELDGMSSDNEGLLIMAATNAPWHLDPAFRRPGRFDRILFVEPPDQESRAKILEIALKDKPVEQVDYLAIAKKTEDFSGADLNALVDICVEEKLRDAFKTGTPSPITTKDLLKAAKKHKASTREWFNSARNYALYANEGGLYDEILKYLNIKK
jgi:transitional endoplasmic reticulum ATPase